MCNRKKIAVLKFDREDRLLSGWFTTAKEFVDGQHAAMDRDGEELDWIPTNDDYQPSDEELAETEASNDPVVIADRLVQMYEHPHIDRDGCYVLPFEEPETANDVIAESEIWRSEDPEDEGKNQVIKENLEWVQAVLQEEIEKK